MTETMEKQEIIFRKKLKSRRAKFDRKIVRNRLLVKERLATDSVTDSINYSFSRSSSPSYVIVAQK